MVIYKTNLLLSKLCQALIEMLIASVDRIKNKDNINDKQNYFQRNFSHFYFYLLFDPLLLFFTVNLQSLNM